MAFTGPAEDRLAIRELYGTYADCAFRQDRDGFLSCWRADGTWSTPFGEVCGHEALAGQWDAIWQTMASMGFFTEIGSIAVTGDSASARAWCREILNLPDGRIRKIVGRYDDELRRDEAGWRFYRRTYAVLIAEDPPTG